MFTGFHSGREKEREVGIQVLMHVYVGMMVLSIALAELGPIPYRVCYLGVDQYI